MLTLPDFRYKQCIVYFSKKGNKLCFRTGTFIIKDTDGQTLLKQACHKTFAFFIIGNISLTNVFLIQAKRHGFPVFILSRNLKLETALNNRAEGNFRLREKQYMSRDQEDLVIAKQLVIQKIRNHRELLKKLRYRSAEDNRAIEELGALCPDSAQGSYELMGVEGLASRIFFSAYFRPLGWKARLPRSKHDIPNLLLDIGYTYLFHFIEAMLSLYGFDLYRGVYHKFFYQRKSLVCDMVEPFRCIIDQRLRKAHNLGQIKESDFAYSNHQFYLQIQNQKHYTGLFLKDILTHKEAIFKYMQAYYRWIMKSKPIEDFPVFHINQPKE